MGRLRRARDLSRRTGWNRRLQAHRRADGRGVRGRICAASRRAPPEDAWGRIVKKLALVPLAIVAAIVGLWLYVPLSAFSPPPPDVMTSVAPRAVPDVAIADGDGKLSSLADFRGKFVLLNLWATW